MKILMTGGTGLVGTILIPHLLARGHQVTVLTRRNIKKLAYLHPPPEGVTLLQYDPSRPGQWQELVAESEVIINLAGLSIFRYWTPRAKEEILKSRLLTTQRLVEALSFRQNRGKSLLSVSGIGYYGSQGNRYLTEQDTAGKDFLARVAQRWEDMARNASQFDTRVVLCRIGNVFSLRGGMLPKLVLLAKCSLGCRWGSGQQWTSWIHEEDLARAFIFLTENREISGPVNITAPAPVQNEELMRLISKYTGQAPLVPFIPAWLIKLLAGELSSVLLGGQRAYPKALQDRAFSFQYPSINEALSELVQEKKSRHTRHKAKAGRCSST